MKRIYILFLMCCSLALAYSQTPDKSWWTFEYPNDKSLDSGLLNLRFLNEQFAGQNGFIQLSDDGNSFTQGNGTAIRFWACNGGNLANDFDDQKLDTLARFLAKMGVNIVRFHGAINPHGKGTDINSVDTAQVNNI